MDQPPSLRCSHSVLMNVGSDKHFGVGDMLKGNTTVSTDWEARSTFIPIFQGVSFHGVSGADHE
jgi:hypothetical protein